MRSAYTDVKSTAESEKTKTSKSAINSMLPAGSAWQFWQRLWWRAGATTGTTCDADENARARRGAAADFLGEARLTIEIF